MANKYNMKIIKRGVGDNAGKTKTESVKDWQRISNSQYRSDLTVADYAEIFSREENQESKKRRNYSANTSGMSVAEYADILKNYGSVENYNKSTKEQEQGLKGAANAYYTTLLLGKQAEAARGLSDMDKIGAELNESLTDDEWKMVTEEPVAKWAQAGTKALETYASGKGKPTGWMADLGNAFSKIREKAQPSMPYTPVPTTDSGVTEESRKFLVEKFGEDKANEYIKYIKWMRDKDAAKAQEEYNASRPTTAFTDVADSVGSVGLGLTSGVTGAADLIAQGVRLAATGQPINWDSDLQRTQQQAQDIRQNVSENIKHGRTGDKESSFRNVASFGYDTGMSYVDSMTTALLGNKVVAGIVLGSNAAVSAAQDAKERGVGDGRALLTGAAAGVFESVFESLSLGKFFEISDAKTMRQMVVRAFAQIPVEGSEELFTEMTNFAADWLINRGKSTIMTTAAQYESVGNSREQALKMALMDAAKQCGLALVGGMVFGAVGGSAGYIRGKAQSNMLSEEYSGANKAYGSVYREGLAGGKSSAEAAKAAQEFVDANYGKDVQQSAINKKAGELADRILSADAKNKDALAVRKALAGNGNILGQAVYGLQEQERKMGITPTASAQQAESLAPNTEAAMLYADMRDGKTRTTEENIGKLYRLVQQEADRNAIVNTESRKTPVSATRQAAEMLVRNTQNRANSEAEQPARVNAATDMQSAGNGQISPRGGNTTQRGGSFREVYTETGGVAQVEGVASVEGRRVQVNLSDGTTVPVSSVRFADAELSRVYQTASVFDTRTARAFVSGYDGSVDANTYSRGFMSIYGAARQGKTMQQAAALTDATAALSPPVQRLAYMAGENSLKAAQPVSALDASVSTVMQMKAGEGGGVTMQVPGGQTVTQQQADQIKALDTFGRAIGRTIYVVDTLSDEVEGKTVSANALYEPRDNSYVIALDSVGEAYMYYAVHESVHDIHQNSELGYAALEDAVFDILREKGEDVDALVQYQKDIMDKEGLSAGEIEDRAREEVVANTVPVILTDESTGKALAERFAESETDTRNWFEKLLDKIEALLQDAYEVLKGQKSWRQMKTIEGDREAIRRIRQEYFDALDAREDATGAAESDARKSPIDYDRNNRPFVVVDRDILHGVKKDQWRKLVSAELAKRFPNGVTISSRKIAITAKSRREMTYSKYVQWLMRDNPSMFADRFRSLNNLDEIIRASRNFVNESLLHPRKDDIVQFARGDVLIRVGNNDYEAKVIVGTRKNGQMLLYDIIDLGKTTIQKKSKMDAHTEGQLLATYRRKGASIDISLPQNDSDVNPSIRDSAEKDTRLDALDAREDNRNTKQKKVFSLKDGDPRTVTEQEVRDMLDKARFGELDNDTYIPARINTPAILRYVAQLKDDVIIEDLPILIPVNKARQMMEEASSDDRNTNHQMHGLEPEDIISMIRAMNDPRYIVLQENGRYAMVVSFKTNRHKIAYAVIDLFDDKGNAGFHRNNEQANGLNDGRYNILVTAYDQAGADEFLKNGKNEIKYSYKEKESLQVTPGRQRPFGINNDPFYTNIVQHEYADVNPSIRDSAEKDTRRFSLKDTDPVDAEQLAEENERLREALAIAQQEVQLTQGHHVTEKALERMTNWVLRFYSSNYDHDTLKARLRDITEYIGNSEVVSWDELSDAGVGLFRDVLEQSSKVDTDAPSYDPEVLKYIRGMRININDQQVQEAADAYDGIGNFRKKYFGRLNLTNDGMGVDVLWDDLATAHPEWFDKDFDGIGKDGSKLDRILEVLEMARAPVVNPYQYDMDMYAADAFLSWLNNSYMNADEVKTFADKQRTKLEQTKARLYNKIQEVREESKLRYYDRLKKERARNAAERKELTRKYREANAEQRDKLRKRYQELTNERITRQRARMQETATNTKYRRRIEKNAKTLMTWLGRPTDSKHVPDSLRKPVYDFLRTIDFAGQKDTNRAEKWRERMRKLADFMQSVDEGRVAGDDYVALDIDSDFVERLRSFIDGTEDVREVSKLNTEQLRELDYLLAIVKRAVTDANTILIDGKRQAIAERGDAIIQNAKRKGIKHRSKFVQSKFGQLLTNGNIKPEYFFEQLGPDMKALFDDIREGQNKYAFNMAKAKSFYDETVEKFHVNDWLNKKGDVLEFTTQRGDRIELTRNQALSLYATANREAANAARTQAKHLENGGFVYEKERTTRKEGGKKITFEDATPKPLSAKDIETIKKWLTKEQTDFADAVVGYMSNDLSALGNETSMQQYGYKKFLEKNYFPYKTSSEYVAMEPGKGTDLQRWKNKGFTKQTARGANTPIVLQDFTTVFANHTNEMLMYNAMSIPQENMVRVFNYKTPVTEERIGESLRAAVKTAYGNGAVSYIDTFLHDLNGGISTDPREGLIGWLTSKFKKSAVAASASVAIQQPSAIGRAFAEIEVKYFVYKKSDWKYKAEKVWYEEAMKYAGTAVIKDIGGFDTGTGVGAANWLTQVNDKALLKGGLKDKATWLSRGLDKLTGAAPAQMDRWSWGYIWFAVKNEIADNNPNLKPGSEEFLQAAGKRFNDVIERTQVYDSVISRSSIMRSKSGVLKAATAFMAESTVNYNMLYDVATHMDKAHAKKNMRIIGAVVGSTILNTALRAIIEAMRDDDDDQTYVEKYAEALFRGLLGERIESIPWQEDSKAWKVIAQVISGMLTSDFSPVQFIPLVRDLVSIMQGYDVERTDMSLISELWAAIDALDSATKPTFEKVFNLVAAAANFAGIPLSNALRELKGIGHTIYGRVTGGRKGFQWRGINEAFHAGINWRDTDSAAEKAEVILRAYNSQRYQNGHPMATAYAERMKNYLVEELGGDEKAYQSKMKSAIKAMYADGGLDQKTAERFLIEHAGADPYATGANSLNAILESALYEGEDDFSIYNDLYDMLDDESTTKKSVTAEINRIGNTYGVSDATIKGRITAELKDDYATGTPLERAAIVQMLLNTGLYGKNRRAVEENVQNWVLGWYWAEYEVQWINEPERRKEIEQMILDAGVNRVDLQRQIRKTQDDMKE